MSKRRDYKVVETIIFGGKLHIHSGLSVHTVQLEPPSPSLTAATITKKTPAVSASSRHPLSRSDRLIHALINCHGSNGRFPDAEDRFGSNNKKLQTKGILTHDVQPTTLGFHPCTLGPLCFCSQQLFTYKGLWNHRLLSAPDMPRANPSGRLFKLNGNSVFYRCRPTPTFLGPRAVVVPAIVAELAKRTHRHARMHLGSLGEKTFMGICLRWSATTAAAPLTTLLAPCQEWYGRMYYSSSMGVPCAPRNLTLSLRVGKI